VGAIETFIDPGLPAILGLCAGRFPLQAVQAALHVLAHERIGVAGLVGVEIYPISERSIRA
jgi:hypothetical protein